MNKTIPKHNGHSLDSKQLDKSCEGHQLSDKPIEKKKVYSTNKKVQDIKGATRQTEQVSLLTMVCQQVF